MSHAKVCTRKTSGSKIHADSTDWLFPFLHYCEGNGCGGDFKNCRRIRIILFSRIFIRSLAMVNCMNLRVDHEWAAPPSPGNQQMQLRRQALPNKDLVENWCNELIDSSTFSTRMYHRLAQRRLVSREQMHPNRWISIIWIRSGRSPRCSFDRH